jgi:hypothetical protein
LLIIAELYLKGSEQAGPDRLVADDWAQSGHDPSPARAARRERRSHAPNQFCNTSGLQTELSEPCNSTHVSRIRFPALSF